MSEPQHPKREGMHPGTGQSGSAAAATNPAARGGQSAGPTFFDSLAAAGARLAQLRQERGWSIDDVSARLKVPAAKLRALEAGDISHFPGTTFALGVVRSYAKMLGVDATAFAQALRRDNGEPEPDLSMPASTGTNMPRGRVSVSLGGTPRHRSWWWGVAAVVVALIALVMWRSGGEPPGWLVRLKAGANGAAAASGATSTAPQGQTVASGAAVMAESAASDVSTGAVPTAPEAASGAMPASAAVASSAEPIVPPQAATPQATTPQATTTQATTTQATTTRATTEAPVPKAQAVAQAPSSSEAPGAAPTADASSASVAAGGSTVALTVTQDSWFSVRDKNGKEVFSGIVHANDTKQVQGAEPFQVVAGNRAGVESIALDGKPVDAAKYEKGKGNVSRFSLP
jgi:cytoskeleton protein RodZ